MQKKLNFFDRFNAGLFVLLFGLFYLLLDEGSSIVVTLVSSVILATVVIGLIFLVRYINTKLVLKCRECMKRKVGLYTWLFSSCSDCKSKKNARWHDVSFLVSQGYIIKSENEYQTILQAPKKFSWLSLIILTILFNFFGLVGYVIYYNLKTGGEIVSISKSESKNQKNENLQDS